MTRRAHPTRHRLDGAPPPRRGLLISVEGLNGVGKTYLIERAVQRLTETGGPVPVLLEEFSRRAHTADASQDLGRALLSTLVRASGGERFLRGGYPGSETLMLLAVKTHDYESVTEVLAAGHTVIEGRSLHSTAVYQSLITHDRDTEAYEFARALLDVATVYRPLPDRVLLLVDDLETAVGRAETRDSDSYTPEQWALHRRAAALFERLAADDPQRVTVLDRRRLDTDALISTITDHLTAAAHDPDPRVLDAG